MDVRAIQQALKDKGFDPGEIDGQPGRRTIAAVKAFQAKNGLEVDGIVGPQTAKALMGAGAAGATAPTGGADTSTPLVWFAEARHLMGVHEDVGPGSNKVILNWAKDLGIDYKSDDIPWCGLFVAHCVGATLPEEVLPSNPLGARNWTKFGKHCEPGLGAILVFWRESRQSGKGHVGFYNGEDSAAYHVLGGNQSDSVSIARVGKDRLLDARQPATVPPLGGGRVNRTETGDLSHDEA
jgi:uncharacterized protein (TIGR02594 family)